MTAEQYNRWTKPLREHPGLLSALKRINLALTGIGYILFPTLLVILFFRDREMMLRCLLTSGISFVLVSAIRKWMDFPRPYEKLEISPLILRKKKGSSFPSRHVFSVCMIAMCWLAFQPVVGGILFAAGILMGIVRVLGGVHFPADVIAGAFIGIGCGMIGLYII